MSNFGMQRQGASSSGGRAPYGFGGYPSNASPPPSNQALGNSALGADLGSVNKQQIDDDIND
eukprot:2315722-Amphidinium_carterae.1